MKKKIGFYGYPPEDRITFYKNQGYQFLDLDIDFNAPDLGLVPATTCQIIKNIIYNAFFYKEDLELILATTGEDKCDSGRFAAWFLQRYGFKVEFSHNTNLKKRPIVVCDSNLPLVDKINIVMDSIVLDSKKGKVFKPLQKPSVGFWGVPPHDFDLLELFPSTTAIYGWIRCVEAGTPSDLELETFVEPGVKTVFFTQTFCPKGILAKELAEKHQGLYIDQEKKTTHSLKAKIQAFLRLC